MPESKSKVASITPLWIVASFVGLTEIVVGIVATQTTGSIQVALTYFVCAFPLLVAAAFFGILWKKPFVFYPPAEFGSAQDVTSYVAAMQGHLPEKSIQKTLISASKKELFNEPSQTTEEKDLQAVPGSEERKQQSLEKPSEIKNNHDRIVDLFEAFSVGKISEAEEIYSSISEAEKDPKKKRETEALYYYFRFSFAEDSDALKNLRGLTEDPTIRSYAYYLIGMAYQRSGEHGRATEAIKESLTGCSDKQRAKRFVSLAEALTANNQPLIAIDALLSALPQFSDADDLATLYEALAGVYENLKKPRMRALALEKAVENNPSNTSARFKAAWEYSQAGHHEIAILHYRTLLKFDQKSVGALNNLAVEFDHFKLPINAVTNYKSAFSGKNTLAGANLAYKFLNAGFVDEARRTIDEAKAFSDVHPNVGSALATLSERTEAENQKLNTILKDGGELQRFLKGLADAFFSTEGADLFIGRWKSKSGQEFLIDCSGGQISGSWKSPEAVHSLSGTALHRGADVSYTVKETKDDGPLAALLNQTTANTGHAYVSKDGNEMRWYFEKDGEHFFHFFTRVTEHSRISGIH
jgi:tetratricopeptide (TPR) repeat protein